MFNSNGDAAAVGVAAAFRGDIIGRDRWRRRAAPESSQAAAARMVDAATPRNVMRGGLPNLDARTVRAMAVVHTQSWGSYPGFVSSGTVSAQSD